MTSITRSASAHRTTSPASWVSISLFLGAVLPVLSAALYHPYTLSMASRHVEITRQLGLPYVLGELIVVLYAQRAGYSIAGIIERIEPRRICRRLQLLRG